MLIRRIGMGLTALGGGASFALALGACGPVATFSPTGPRQEPREKDCDFDVLTTLPESGFEEIGTIDLRWVPDTREDFKYLIGPQVCQAGADAVLAMINGKGEYIKGTALKQVADAPKRARAKAPSSASGCQYDDQCKGDRICVSGECVDPPPKTPEATAAPPVGGGTPPAEP